MTEKRYFLKYSEWELSNGKTIQAEPYFIDKKGEFIDTAYFTIDGYPTMSDEQVLDLLNENEELKQLIKKVLETTPMKHKLAIELKNSVRDLYD